MRRWIGAACLLSAACGHSQTAPTPFVPPAPVVTGLRIQGGADAIRTGFSADFTPSVVYADGSTARATVTWASSAPGIGTVNANGHLDGLRHGSLTLSMTGHGFTVSRTISVVQNFGGRWSGTYVITACDQSGDFLRVRWCQGFGQPGMVRPFSLNLEQFGADQHYVIGTIGIGQIAGEITGSVTDDARLVIGGTYLYQIDATTLVQVTIGGWDTRASASDSMAGRWAQSYVLPNFVGNAYQQHSIMSATHLTQQ